MRRAETSRRGFLAGALSAAAAEGAGRRPAREIQYGPLRLAFEPDSGNLLRIGLRNEIIAETAAGILPVSVATGPADHPQWLDEMDLRRELVRFSEPAPGSVEVTFRAGDFELLVRYRLHAGQARLDRSARLTYHGSQTIKLRNFLFRTAGVRAEGDGFYRYPQTWPPTRRRFADMTPGKIQLRGGSIAEASGSIAPLAAQVAARRTLLWLACTDDDPAIAVVEGAGQFEVRQEVQAMGYLRPGQPQEIGFVSLLVVEGDYRAALANYQSWLEDIGDTVPADRAPWVPGTALYSFHPGGTIGSNWKDLGGFGAARERLLPTLGRLGVSALWILPVEYRGPYSPYDYYRFMEGLGTPDEYGALVAKAHEMGLHVLQDLVPHGGTPAAVHNRQHPEFMLRREDGSTLNYWLDDFARPDWQAFIAAVAAYYVREYGVDGYRVDAADGSKEPNWDPRIPYARASLARLWGGLGMLRAIRPAVRKLKPRDGAILTEVQSTRHWPYSDLMFDFAFIRFLPHEWRRRPPDEYAAWLQEYFTEQTMVEPRGAIWLRGTDYHDTLRAQLWWGVEGMRTVYALSAWIDGVPMIYQGMERGHAFELRRINEIRRSRPELSRGAASYHDVRSDTPGVFTCVRTLGERQSVVAINFNPDPVRAKITWPRGSAAISLKPAGYTVIPEPKPAATAEPEERTAGAADTVGWRRIPGGLAFPDATEWFIDTIEGRLHDEFIPLRPNLPPVENTGVIYWRPQTTALIWQNDLPPLHPVHGAIGVRQGREGWTLIRFADSAPAGLRLVEYHEGQTGLFLLGLEADDYSLSSGGSLPAAPDVTKSAAIGEVSLRVVGPDYILGNAHFTAVLRRQGGVMRELRAGDRTLARDHDLYGDGEYLRVNRKPILAGHDVECGLRVSRTRDGLRLVFQGQLRGFTRFATRRPPIWYRNEYSFSGEGRVTEKWAFRTAEPIRTQPALLGWSVALAADQFRFIRSGGTLAEGRIPDSDARVAAGAPDAVILSRGGKVWLGLEDLRFPASAKAFVQGNRLCFALLDSREDSLEADTWHECEAVWDIREDG